MTGQSDLPKPPAQEVARTPTILTTKIRGIDVLARDYEGEASAIGYANRTQAERKAAQMGDGWRVYHFSRPFYVGRT